MPPAGERERRCLDGRTARRDLRPDLRGPRARAAAGIGDGERDGAARRAGDAEVPERERLRVGEDHGRVRGRNRNEARALDEHGRLLGLRRVCKRRPSGGHERRLHLLRRPGRMALEQEGRGTGDMRCGEARPVEDRERVSGELRQRRGQDLRARRGDVGLERLAERGQAAGREARRDARPRRAEPRASRVNRTWPRPPEPAIACRSRAPSRSEIVPPFAAERARTPDRPGGCPRRQFRSRPHAWRVRPCLVRASAPADERDRTAERPGRERRAVAAEEAAGAADRADVDEPLVGRDPGGRDGAGRHEGDPPEGTAGRQRRGLTEHMSVRRRRRH